MIPIQVNEELFAANPFFSGKPERLEEAKSFFQFDQRRVVLGQRSLDRLGEECQRLRAGRVLLVRDPGIATLEAPVREALESQNIELVVGAASHSRGVAGSQEFSRGVRSAPAVGRAFGGRKPAGGLAELLPFAFFAE